MPAGHAGGLGDAIRKGANMVHGTGEAIRGNINATVDDVAGDQVGYTKNKEVAQKGVDEWDKGYRGHAVSQGPAGGEGVFAHNGMNDAANTSAGGVSGSRAPADMEHPMSRNHGPHATEMGNKVDPRVDSKGREGNVL